MSIIARIVAIITRRFHPRGTQRILRLLFNPRTSRIKAVVPYDSTLRIYVDTSSFVEWEVFFRGYYEERAIRLIKRILREGDVAFDVGANIGTHTLIMSNSVGVRGRVFAFDPDPPSRKKLLNNIELNELKNVRVFPLALSDSSGVMKLFSYSNSMLDQGTASLYDLPSLEKTEIQVEVSTIDEVVKREGLERFDFVKIDTRGSDFPIIRGARNSIQRFQPFVLFEYNFENWQHSQSVWSDVQKFFDDLGYSLNIVTRSAILPLHGEPKERTSHNILAVPKGKKV